MNETGFEEELDLPASIRRSITLRPFFPRIVCLCGSTRFHRAFQDAQLMETLDGNIVLTIGCNLRSDEEIFKEMFQDGSLETIQDQIDRLKSRLDLLHLRKIDLADEVLILNVGGYIGESTLNELDYAHRRGKKIRFWEEGYSYVLPNY